RRARGQGGGSARRRARRCAWCARGAGARCESTGPSPRSTRRAASSRASSGTRSRRRSRGSRRRGGGAASCPASAAAAAPAVRGPGGGGGARAGRAPPRRARAGGAEMTPEVVRAARRHFGLDALGVEVVLADAQAWLERARGRFDLVIEDVFTGRGRQVRKPVWLPRPGLGLAARRVAPGGILTINALDDAP